MTTVTEDKVITFVPDDTMYHRNSEGKPEVSFKRKTFYEGIVHADGRISAINPKTKQRVFISAQYISIYKGAMYV